MSLAKTYIDHVKKAVELASKHSSKITKDSDVLNIDGMSSEKIRHVLNNLCSLNDCRYLEIGTWKGSTLLSALYNNMHAKATCIENFSDFNGPREEFLMNAKRNKEAGNVPVFDFIEKDCFSIDPGGIEKKNVYFFDGGHVNSNCLRSLYYFYYYLILFLRPPLRNTERPGIFQSPRRFI
jgi:hypothetical protein